MKRKYVKPETEVNLLRLSTIIATSPNEDVVGEDDQLSNERRSIWGDDDASGKSLW